jgi:hypothetical protein
MVSPRRCNISALRRSADGTGRMPTDLLLDGVLGEFAAQLMDGLLVGYARVSTPATPAVDGAIPRPDESLKQAIV